jgi:hypothetical protein
VNLRSAHKVRELYNELTITSTPEELGDCIAGSQIVTKKIRTVEASKFG